jgi:hypothetical protein
LEFCPGEPGAESRLLGLLLLASPREV